MVTRVFDAIIRSYIIRDEGEEGPGGLRGGMLIVQQCLPCEGRLCIASQGP